MAGRAQSRRRSAPRLANHVQTDKCRVPHAESRSSGCEHDGSIRAIDEQLVDDVGHSVRRRTWGNRARWWRGRPRQWPGPGNAGCGVLLRSAHVFKLFESRFHCDGTTSGGTALRSQRAARAGYEARGTLQLRNHCQTTPRGPTVPTKYGSAGSGYTVTVTERAVHTACGRVVVLAKATRKWPHSTRQ